MGSSCVQEVANARFAAQIDAASRRHPEAEKRTPAKLRADQPFDGNYM
jgi:hypothetical protein